jgi:WD40 repeat protein
MLMVKLRLLPAPPPPRDLDGELGTCVYTPDGSHILSGGWDGYLRIWDAATGSETASFRASNKPLIACAVSPDSRFYLSACLNGFLAHWDAKTLKKAAYFLAHWRPISCIAYGYKGQMFATASWDMNLILWDVGPSRDWRPLSGHEDIVAGCCFTPTGRQLLSWSHDATLKLWDVEEARLVCDFNGHRDRVTTAAISADGRWAASGSRDKTLRLWDLVRERAIACATLAAGIKGCFFLADGRTLLAVNDDGCLSIHHLPGLEQHGELLTELPVLQGALNPRSDQLALACSDGRLHRVAVEGVEPAPPAPHAEKRSGHKSRSAIFGKKMRKLLHFARDSAAEKTF